MENKENHPSGAARPFAGGNGSRLNSVSMDLEEDVSHWNQDDGEDPVPVSGANGFESAGDEGRPELLSFIKDIHKTIKGLDSRMTALESDRASQRGGSGGTRSQSQSLGSRSST